jgi:phosphoribosylglycinamide formyltransferase-1
MNLAILASHNGSALDSIYTAINNQELDLKLKIIVSNNTNANVLQKAKNYNIKYSVINANLFKNPDQEILQTLQQEEIECIFLAGYMKKLSPIITHNFKVINSHPALLPKFGGKGMYGRFVHEAVIQNKEKISGVTIHEVNENYDEGKIILQQSLTLNKDETVQSLEERIKKLEKIVIVKGLKRCLSSQST